jgi:hypothetical protein
MWPFIPSTTEVKNEWSYDFTPPLYLHGTDRENFTFFLLLGLLADEKIKKIICHVLLN